MIRMSELMQDAWYAKFLDRNPRLDDKHRGLTFRSKAWTVYVQRDAGGKWGKREFNSYKKALKFLKFAVSRGVHDAALNNRRIWSPPPHRMVRIRGKFVQDPRTKEMVQATKRVEWKPRLMITTGAGVTVVVDHEEHEWCGYCRRPTVFKHYVKHRILGGVTNDVDRCCICGASRRIAPPPSRRRY